MYILLCLFGEMQFCLDVLQFCTEMLKCQEIPKISGTIPFISKQNNSMTSQGEMLVMLNVSKPRYNNHFAQHRCLSQLKLLKQGIQNRERTQNSTLLYIY